jgi:arylsulfatase A-like enzyme
VGCAVGFFLLAAAVRGAAEPDRPPNVVLLFADDLGYGSTSSYGGEVPTPNIDSIVHQGIKFTSGYMTAPVCNPTRQALLTGRYQQRWGSELNYQTVAPVGAAKGTLGIEHTTIANALKKRGYTNGAFGKWQLGMRELLHPLDRGFDYFFGMSAGMNYLDPDWPGAHYLSVDVPRFEGDLPGVDEGEENPDRILGLYRGRELIPLEEYLTEHLARESAGFIERNRDRPFFVYLAFNAPHVPLQVTDKYYQRFPQYESEAQRIYAGMISALDDAVGVVLAKLRETGLDENTLVIFASDNGAVAEGDGVRRSNRPLIGHKRNLYEGGIRVPFAMRWKGRLEAGRRYTQPVSSLDLFPTAVTLAGETDLEQYRLDGVNLLPYLEGEKEGSPHEYLFWRSGPNAAVRSGSWKLLMIGSEITRLYDVDRDPAESRDLASQQPAVVERLKAAFDRWNQQMERPRESGRQATTKFNGDVIKWHI